MKITNQMIHPDLRRRGKAIKLIFKLFRNENAFYRVQKFLTKYRKRMKNNHLNMTETYIKTEDNDALRLCIYKSKQPKEKAVGLLWFHGGGYAIGTPEQDANLMNNLIDAEHCVIVSPDYRLSTELPYPAAVNDCYNSLLWMKEHAEELGIDRNRLFVGGSSAGGGLAIAVSLMARDRQEVNIAFLMPFYPMIDDRMITESAKANDAPVWNSKTNEAAWKLYLGDLYGSVNVPSYAAPSRETKFENLPPMYTFVGDLEPFHDETKLYVEHLINAGVTAEIDIYEGCYHAFDNVARKAEISKKAIARYIKVFQSAAFDYSTPQPEELDHD